MLTVGQLLDEAGQALQGVDNPQHESRLLLSFTLDRNPAHFIAWPETKVPEEKVNAFMKLVARRLVGEPIAYCIGRKAFHDVELKVTSDTLIPRPETEILVDRLLTLVKPNMQIVDVGTGSGAIACALAHAYPECEIKAVDYSSKALCVAQENAERLNLKNIQFIESDVLSFFLNKGRMFDIVVSNPPYIAEEDPHLERGDLRFEPIMALASGAEGLDCIERLVEQSTKCLKPGGHLLLEHGYNQQPSIISLMRERGYAHVMGYKDLAQLPRFCEGRWLNL